jgi:ubiquitin C-terminal hydrolase
MKVEVDRMFGLRNQRGSCWVNAALQGIFRIPSVQHRYMYTEADGENPMDVCLQTIWTSKGEDGLRDFYECVKLSPNMPAGDNIGDSHELLQLLCDKLPYLDKLMRFKLAHTLKCNHCKYNTTQHTSDIEYTIAPSAKTSQTLSNAVADSVRQHTVSDWTCEKCKQTGCTKQMLLASFPQVLVFHQTSVDTNVTYSAVFVINSIKYVLFAVVCFNGGHWWTYGRDLPPGKPWYELNDTSVRAFDGKYFPLVDGTMRLLMYYRFNE